MVNINKKYFIEREFEMATPTNIGTRELPLIFAAKVSKCANAEFNNFQFAAATPITNELLRFETVK